MRLRECSSLVCIVVIKTTIWGEKGLFDLQILNIEGSHSSNLGRSRGSNGEENIFIGLFHSLLNLFSYINQVPHITDWEAPHQSLIE